MQRIGRRSIRALGAAAVAIVLVTAYVLGTAGYRIDHFREVGRLPKLSPDYGGISIPYNIAPLNFVIQEPGRRYQVRLTSGSRRIVVSSRGPGIRIPTAAWKTLLGENRGGKLGIEVFVDREGEGWEKYETVVDRISPDPVDPYLVYREIFPQFYAKSDMSIRERCLEDFSETTLLDPRQLPGGGCFNCHSFCNYKSDRFAIQVRYRGQGYLLVRDRGRTTLVQPVFRKPGSAFLAWHPSGKAIALAVDMDYKLFNLYAGLVPEETLEFVDTGGDLAVYRLEDNSLSTSPAVSRLDRLETHPAWSPDGKYLYFVSALTVPVTAYRNVKYDLRRIGYDITTGVWGKSETLVSAEDTGLSCSFPRVSPDGRFVLFGMSDRSSLTLLREKTDLYLMDLASKSYRKLETNSDRTDSYHTWASNGRWFAFVSKRRDGVHGLVYFSHVGEDGSVTKPFVLPQSDPAYYESFVRTYNVPEFLGEPMDIGQFALGREVMRVDEIVRPRLVAEPR